MFSWTVKTRRRARGLLAMSMLAAFAGAGGMLAATGIAAANGDVIHISSTKNTSIKIAKGKPRTIKTNVPFYEIVIGDPEIANVNPLTDSSFYVLGSNLGTTGIALFDENKQLVGTVDNEVTLDTDRLASTIRNSVPGGEDIRALEDRGVARRLAEPNLIARSGQKASFLAGGEVPIPVAEEEGVITVDYKKFGVGLEFTPTVLADGLISLEIAPEVSSVDRSQSYSVGNISLPGFVVRRAQTSVDLKSGQSFMMAGLLQTENDMIQQGVPGLSKLPVLGPLFSSKAYQRRETDLVIIVTPYLVKPIDPSKKPRVPTDGTVPGSNVDYFLGNTEEVRVSDAGVPIAKAGAAAAQVGSGHILDLP